MMGGAETPPKPPGSRRGAEDSPGSCRGPKIPWTFRIRVGAEVTDPPS
jgi:hypothetical protein